MIGRIAGSQENLWGLEGLVIFGGIFDNQMHLQ